MAQTTELLHSSFHWTGAEPRRSSRKRSSKAQKRRQKEKRRKQRKRERRKDEETKETKKTSKIKASKAPFPNKKHLSVRWLVSGLVVWFIWLFWFFGCCFWGKGNIHFLFGSMSQSCCIYQLIHGGEDADLSNNHEVHLRASNCLALKANSQTFCRKTIGLFWKKAKIYRYTWYTSVLNLLLQTIMN